MVPAAGFKDELPLPQLPNAHCKAFSANHSLPSLPPGGTAGRLEIETILDTRYLIALISPVLPFAFSLSYFDRSCFTTLVRQLIISHHLRSVTHTVHSFLISPALIITTITDECKELYR